MPPKYVLMKQFFFVIQQFDVYKNYCTVIRIPEQWVWIHLRKVVGLVGRWWYVAVSCMHICKYFLLVNKQTHFNNKIRNHFMWSICYSK